MSFTIATNLDDALQALAAGAKPIAGGVPAAAFGMTETVAAAVADAVAHSAEADVSGIGGTLSGNALSLAAIRAIRGRA